MAADLSGLSEVRMHSACSGAWGLGHGGGWMAWSAEGVRWLAGGVHRGRILRELRSGLLVTSTGWPVGCAGSGGDLHPGCRQPPPLSSAPHCPQLAQSCQFLRFQVGQDSSRLLGQCTTGWGSQVFTLLPFSPVGDVVTKESLLWP